MKHLISKSIYTFASIAMAGAIFTAPAHAEDTAGNLSLVVTVDGANANTGQIILKMFDSEETFMKTPMAEKIVAVDDQGQAVITLEGLTSGDYSLVALYDEDSNGKMNKNFIGIPREKAGFSNNAKPKMGPPPYEKLVFSLTEDSTQNITVHSLTGK